MSQTLALKLNNDLVMNKSLTNIIVLIGIVITTVAGYILFSQNSVSLLTSNTADLQLQQLLASSQLFVERSRTLSEIDMDTSILEDEVFNSLKSYSPPPNEFEVGRPNPFAPTFGSTPSSP
jgi:hypothetical protein